MSVERVDKPWGYEIRFARTERYSGKVLFIHAGHRLSLQSHRVKDEAIFMQEGTMDLVLAQGADQHVVRLEAGEARHLPPGTVHRFHAITDCVVFEVSTPEWDDVVRLEDDYGRLEP